MKQKVKCYILEDTNAHHVAELIKEEINNGWFVVSIAGENLSWIVVYQKQIIES